MMLSIRNLLEDPELQEMDTDGPARLNLHSKILKKKAMLRTVFKEFHLLFRTADLKFLTGKGLHVELGAGVAPIRDTFPEGLATDVVDGEGLDLVINALEMDFDPGTVRVFYGQNCFHHFSDPNKFFAEAERVLVDGGGIILLEPYYGPVASFLYNRLFKTEVFDKMASSWETFDTGPMSGANQALSYNIFIRDKLIFEKKYPHLKIVHQELVSNYLKYFLSGGLNFRQIIPNYFTKFISGFEKAIFPFNKWLALHHVIVIRKIQS